MALRSALVLLALVWADAALAAPIDQVTLDVLGPATVSRVADDGTLILADGRTLRLAGIELVSGHAAVEAHQALARLVALGPLALKGDGPAEDRYGRMVAQAFAADGTWVEGELLRQGLARVATTVDHRRAAPALYAAERGARAHRLGLWRDPKYALRRPEQTSRLIDSWQVVDGVVASAEVRHASIDLHFGDDPGRDLTVRVPMAVARTMAVDPASLANRHVRVRGWIGKGIGPMILLNHPEQIEIVGRAHLRLADDP